MHRARQRLTALFVCLIFSALELLSAAPALHRHDQGMDAFLRPACASAASAAATSAALPRVALPRERGNQAPRECPACTISGLFAIASYSVPVAVPVTHPRRIASFGIRAAASPVIASLRGRAPPLG